MAGMRKILFASIFVLGFCFGAFGQDSPCPTISVIGPASVVMPKENVNFTANVGGETGNLELKYFWSVDKGKIIEGQGTTVVTIGEIPLDSTLTATVEIKGLPENCPKIASETMLTPHGPTRPIEIEQLKTSASQLDKVKFDKLIVALKDEPTTTAYVIIYTDEKTSSKKLRRKEQQIRKYLSEKNVPADRFIIVAGGGGGDLMRLFVVPAGAEPPTP